MEVRLQKLIASTGLSSRRKAEMLIVSGRVSVNGKVVTELVVSDTSSSFANWHCVNCVKPLTLICRGMSSANFLSINRALCQYEDY